jgi:hypothetical protein
LVVTIYAPVPAGKIPGNLAHQVRIGDPRKRIGAHPDQIILTRQHPQHRSQPGGEQGSMRVGRRGPPAMQRSGFDPFCPALGAELNENCELP